jgi:hypothetical protein
VLQNQGVLISNQSNGILIHSTNGTLKFGTGNTGAVRATIDSTSATFAGTVIAPAATTALAPMRIPHGTAPTSPVDGDMWTTTAGLFIRINGATVGPLS